MPAKTQKQNPEPAFKLASDAERGIVEVVYQCSECNATETPRFFRDETPPAEFGCANCRAGFGGKRGAMFPVIAGEALAN